MAPSGTFSRAWNECIPSCSCHMVLCQQSADGPLLLTNALPGSGDEPRKRLRNTQHSYLCIPLITADSSALAFVRERMKPEWTLVCRWERKRASPDQGPTGCGQGNAYRRGLALPCGRALCPALPWSHQQERVGGPAAGPRQAEEVWVTLGRHAFTSCTNRGPSWHGPASSGQSPAGATPRHTALLLLFRSLPLSRKFLLNSHL